jgi:hypothetical protein
MTQNQINHPSALFDRSGKLTQVGWSPQPLLDCNLENARFYSLRALQRFRIKRWDYYAVFTPQRFFSATIADLGYAGNIFVYTLDFTTHELHEEGLVVPFCSGVHLPRNSHEGETLYDGQGVKLHFEAHPESRSIFVDWPKFHDGRGIHAELRFYQPPRHESMNIVIPIQKKRFYLNRKINCLPVEGTLKYGDIYEELQPETTLGSLDWGRGVWEYQSFWNWASASGFLPDGRTVGLNLGMGFGDISKATENALILDGCVHKLDQVPFDYTSGDYMKPWRFKDNQGRLDVEFVPFKERIAKTNLGIINSEVHQMFGKYSGIAVADNGEEIQIQDLIGFAEEHRAKW